MGRLIDADSLIKRIKEEPTDGMFTEEIIEVINKQPTAYDVDKVVEELEEERAIAFITLANTCDEKLDVAYQKVAMYMDKAIDIVKKGGVENDK